MNEYIATFFTHYDAIIFKKTLFSKGINAVCAPVPRALSSSCGTAVLFACNCEPSEFFFDDVEQLAKCDNYNYTIIFSNK